MKTPFIGTTPDYTYCSPKAPAFNDAAHAIIIGCILQEVLRETV